MSNINRFRNLLIVFCIVETNVLLWLVMLRFFSWCGLGLLSGGTKERALYISCRIAMLFVSYAWGFLGCHWFPLTIRG